MNTVKGGCEELLAKHKDADSEAVAEGRVMVFDAVEPSKGGFWWNFQEFARTLNWVVKHRNPQHLRIVATYDKPAHQEDK